MTPDIMTGRVYVECGDSYWLPYLPKLTDVDVIWDPTTEASFHCEVVRPSSKASYTNHTCEYHDIRIYWEALK